jgi:serine/threonine protein kinase
MIGQKIHNYHIEELLGEGGMGTVYRAIDTVLQRTVAVKVLHPHLVRDSSFFERFRNEAILSAKLSHPNVAMLYNFFSEKNDNYMIMEFIDGLTLEKLLKQHGGLSVEIVFKIMIQALEGLQHAHEKGIFHRDIKPANLMLTKDGRVKLMDFGIARMVGSQRLTRADRVVGTLEYMAPELLDGSEATVQSDLYAIGVLMYELLSGKMPFEATTDATLITQILTKKPIPIRNRIKDLPKKIEEILDSLLQKKPEKRFVSANDLRQTLANLVAPSLVTLQMLQSQTTEMPATSQYEKAKTTHSFLGETQVLASKQTVIQQINKKLFTAEGLILGGSILAALLILVGGIFFFTADEAKKDDVVIITPTTQVTLPTEEKPQDDFVNTPIRPVETPTTKDEPIKPKQKEEKLKQEKAKEEKNKQERTNEPTKKDEPPAKTLVVAPSTPVEKAPETVKEVARPAAKVTKTVSLRNMSVALALDETISSNDANIKGRMVALRILDDVVVDGVTVIQAGTRANGIVTNARSSNDGKSFLEFRPERVQAVNGQWISLKSPSLGKSGSTLEAVIFTKGTRILPDPKTVSTILNITL